MRVSRPNLDGFYPSSHHSAAAQWEHGYALGRVAVLDEDLPHPQDAHVWYHAIRAALHPRGMTISLFMRVIPLTNNQGETLS